MVHRWQHNTTCSQGVVLEVNLQHNTKNLQHDLFTGCCVGGKLTTQHQLQEHTTRPVHRVLLLVNLQHNTKNLQHDNTLWTGRVVGFWCCVVSLPPTQHPVNRSCCVVTYGPSYKLQVLQWQRTHDANRRTNRLRGTIVRGVVVSKPAVRFRSP